MRLVYEISLLSLCVAVSTRLLADEPPLPPPSLAPASTSVAAEVSPPTATATKPAAAAADAHAAAPPAAATTTLAKNDAADEAATTKRLRGAGYKPEKQNGQVVYCKSETEMGSHFERKSCGTAHDIDLITLHSKDFVNDMQQKNNFGPKSGP